MTTTTRKKSPPSPHVADLQAVLGRALDRAEQLMAEGRKEEGLALVGQVLDIIDTANGSARERMRAMRP